MRGIDISSGSGSVNFQALKAAGYEFVIARAGYGSSIKQTDARFHAYVRDALEAGLHVGAYWFIYARTIDEALENAKCFVSVVSGWRGKLDMPLYIDYEYDSTRYYEQEVGVKENRAIATEYIRQAAAYVEKCGYYSGVYLNPDYIKNHVDLPKLSHFTLWLAQWGSDKPAYDCGLWQTHGDTKIPEAAGGVDLDQCFVDFPTVIRRNGLNGFTPSDAPQTESTSDKSGDKWETVDTGDGYTVKLRGKGMMYQGVMQVQDFDKVMETDTRYVRTYSITPRLGTIEDVENYLMGKINVGATFNCIAEDISGIPINRTIGFGILDDTGEVVKEY